MYVQILETEGGWKITWTNEELVKMNQFFTFEDGIDTALEFVKGILK